MWNTIECFRLFPLNMFCPGYQMYKDTLVILFMATCSQFDLTLIFFREKAEQQFLPLSIVSPPAALPRR